MENSSGKLILDSLKAAGITIPISFILLLIMNFISYSNDDPYKLLSALAYTALFLSMFVCGVISEKFNSGNGLICGAVSGIILIAVMLLISVFAGADGQFSVLHALLIYSGGIAVSAIGGFISERLSENRNKNSAVKIRKNIRNKYAKR